jgi:hypothetical protein
MIRAHSFVIATFATCSVACSALAPPPPLPLQEVLVKVSADVGKPLPGVAVRPSSGKPALTDARGVARLGIPGEEGAKVDLAVVCPEGYAAPANATRITIRRASRVPEFEIPCKSFEHAVLIAFKTSGAAGIPILYLGREVARTDASGHALVELEPKVGETLEFVLDTSDAKLGALRPQSPTRSVRVPDGDEVFTVEQKFLEEKPKIVRKAAKKHFIPIDLSKAP